MATIKSYTDIEQSKKLAEILPLESADMFYRTDGSVKLMWEHLKNIPVTTPSWSLAALLDALPQEILEGEFVINITEGLDNKWIITYDHIDNVNHSFYGLSTGADNLVDACVDLLTKLKDRKMV